MIDIKLRKDSPDQLLEKIRNLINNQTIDTWRCDEDGDFYHNRPQWMGRAWLRAKTDDDPRHLMFVIIEPREERLSKVTYGVYHGRFAEMLLTHFDTSMEDLRITPMLIHGFDIYSKE